MKQKIIWVVAFCVILGLIKLYVMWTPDPSDDDIPTKICNFTEKVGFFNCEDIAQVLGFELDKEGK